MTTTETTKPTGLHFVDAPWPTKATPPCGAKRGPGTNNPARVTCPECRQVLRDFDDDTIPSAR